MKKELVLVQDYKNIVVEKFAHSPKMTYKKDEVIEIVKDLYTNYIERFLE